MMIFKGVMVYLGIKSGKKKNGDDWHLIHLQDDDGHHWNFFVNDLTPLSHLNQNDLVDVVIDSYYDLKRKGYVFYLKEIMPCL